MKSEILKTTLGLGAIIIGLALCIGGVRIGTDPELELVDRAMAAGALTPAGVLFLRQSYRVMRKTES
jgi:hypothetical protein